MLRFSPRYAVSRTATKRCTRTRKNVLNVGNARTSLQNVLLIRRAASTNTTTDTIKTDASTDVVDTTNSAPAFDVAQNTDTLASVETTVNEIVSNTTGVAETIVETIASTPVLEEALTTDTLASVETSVTEAVSSASEAVSSVATEITGHAPYNVPWHRLVTGEFAWWEIIPLPGQSLIEAIHLGFGMPYWLIIVLCSTALRAALLYPTIKQSDVSARMAKIHPITVKLNKKVMKAKDSETRKKIQQEITALNKANGIDFMQMAVRVFLPNIALVLPMFLAIRGMGQVVDGFDEGGILWFQNLAESDPTFLLPIFSAATMSAMVLATSSMQPSWKKQSTVRYIMPGLAGVAGIALAFFPAALHLYWATNNFFMLMLQLAMRNNSIRARLGITLWPESGDKPPEIKGPELHTKPPTYQPDPNFDVDLAQAARRAEASAAEKHAKAASPDATQTTEEGPVKPRTTEEKRKKKQKKKRR